MVLLKDALQCLPISLGGLMGLDWSQQTKLLAVDHAF